MGRQSSNQIKVKKQKRMRRAYLKQYFGVIKVGQAIDKSKVPRGMEGIVDYRQRGNTYWDAYLEAKFPSKGMESPERQEALRKSRLDCVDKLNCLTQEVVPEMNVVIYRGGITKTIVRFYFSSDYTTCFFMKEDWNAMVIHKSGVYGSKDRAMFNWRNKSVNWFESVPIPLVLIQPG